MYAIRSYYGLFRVMDGLPVIIRLIDPPLHEFLPNHIDLMRDLSDHKIRLRNAGTLEEIDALLDKIEKEEHILKRVESLHESNPMLGLRGVRITSYNVCYTKLLRHRSAHRRGRSAGELPVLCSVIFDN